MLKDFIAEFGRSNLGALLALEGASYRVKIRGAVVAEGRTEPGKLLAIEVKSGRRKDGLVGIAAFLKSYPKARPLLVGADGVGIDEFLLKPVEAWFG